MKNVNSIYIYAQSEGWELLTHADDNTSVWTRSLSGFMLHKFCISSISSIIGPRFFLFFCWNPPWPTPTHTFLHINCLTIIIESPRLSQISDQKCHFPQIFQTWKRALQFPQTFQKTYRSRKACVPLVRNTTYLAWRWANSSGELREVVGLMQVVKGLLPLVLPR